MVDALLQALNVSAGDQMKRVERRMLTSMAWVDVEEAVVLADRNLWCTPRVHLQAEGNWEMIQLLLDVGVHVQGSKLIHSPTLSVMSLGKVLIRTTKTKRS